MKCLNSNSTFLPCFRSCKYGIILYRRAFKFWIFGFEEAPGLSDQKRPNIIIWGCFWSLNRGRFLFAKNINLNALRYKRGCRIKNKGNMFKKNIDFSGRMFRLAIAVTLLIYAVWMKSWVALIFSAFTFFESFMSWCVLYQLIGKNSCPIDKNRDLKD